jgi:ATP-binding protein involved in chromosome partitioning
VHGVKNIILVASGKGGVGKSTVAANLAITLAELGHKVGLLDADIYGPSVPLMFGIHEKPQLTHDGRMIPHVVDGINLMSIGFLVEEAQAIVWRGPMLAKALAQMMLGTYWGLGEELDFLIIDTPPGTGDIHISLATNYNITGAIVVSTPQKLAVIDANKAIVMFEKLAVPLLGAVENMSYLIHDNKKLFLFGEDGMLNYCQKNDVKLLAQIPIIPDLCQAGDLGRKALSHIAQAEVTEIFKKIIGAL